LTPGTSLKRGINGGFFKDFGGYGGFRKGLSLSLETVKSHLKNIYQKLGDSHRSEELQSSLHCWNGSLDGLTIMEYIP
jgi:hypothetical protein